MFDNVGGSIKRIAKFACAVGIVCSIVLGIIVGSMWSETSRDGFGSFIIGVLIILVGSFMSWISVLCLYGYGELIENSAIIAENIDIEKKTQKEAHKKKLKRVELPPEKSVSKTPQPLDGPDEYIDLLCPFCGSELSFTKQTVKDSKDLTCPMCDKSFPSNSIV